MRYFRSYQFIFDNPKWLPNLMFVALCQLIPVIGPIVASGYLFEVVEDMCRRHDDRGYPDFTFDRFAKYLVRGLWPFLVQLVITLPISMLIGILWVLGMVVVGVAAGGKEPAPGMAVLVFGAMFAVFLGLMIALSLLMVPFTLRAGLGQDFAASFSLEFLRDFVSRMWLETILTPLFLMATGTVLVVAGMVLCCIGMYPATAMIVMAQHHLYYQLYELYLQRGGTPIPLKRESEFPAY
jgi:hypothetical protein